MEKFKSFITEQKEEAYKLVMFHNSHEHLRDVGKQDAPDYKLMTKAANTVGVDLFHAEFQGSRIEEKGDKLFLHSFAFDEKTGLSIKPAEDGESDFQKPFEINPENTLIFPRGLGTLGFTSNRRWVDMIKLLENKGFKTVPSIETWDACTSKYYCNELFRLNGLRTPKTIPVTYSDDSKRIMEDLKFPVILKASSGSQTGIGVIIVESLRSLHPTVQMLSLLTKNIDLILQEHIKIEYDVRVIVLRGNAKLVNGDLVGVDFLPSKNREKEQPYILEVNSMPGFSGIERSTKDKSVTTEILKTYMNRENWR